MYNQIDASSSVSLIFLLAVISPAFCSERNRTNPAAVSSIKEHLGVDSHVSEIYLSNETFQNSSILSNENQTLPTSSENQTISIALPTPLRNSFQLENLTIIDLNSNISYINKENTRKVNASLPTNSNQTSNISIIEENLNLNNKSHQNAYFNGSNLLKFNVIVPSVNKPESHAEINSNSLLNSSGKHHAHDEHFNSSYSRRNITGVGIKATVSVSLQLMGGGQENATNSLNKTESSQNLTESNQNWYNISSNFNVTDDYWSTTSPGTNNANDNSSEIITDPNNASLQNFNITTVDYQWSEVEATVTNGSLTAPSVVDKSNVTVATVTDSEIRNSASDTTPSSEQSVDFSTDVTKVTTYTSVENVTGNWSEKISETTASFLDTTVREETTTFATTTEKPPLTKMAGVLKIVRGLDWKPELVHHHTADYKRTAKNIRILLEEFFNRTDLNENVQEIQIDGFSQGKAGVVIDYILILKTEYVDQDALIHKVNSRLKQNNDSLGGFAIDPKATHFEVIREETTGPTSAPSIEPPVPQWVIAVVVISAASFIFILLFSAVTIYERHYTRRVYNTKLQDDEEAFEKSITLNGRSSHTAYENLAADLVYDIDKEEVEENTQYWKTFR